MGLTTNTIPRTVALLNQIQDIDPCIGIGATNDTHIGDISVHAFHLTRDVLDDAIGQGGGVTGNVVLGLLVGPTHNGVVGVVALTLNASGARDVFLVEGTVVTHPGDDEKNDFFILGGLLDQHLPGPNLRATS